MRALLVVCPFAAAGLLGLFAGDRSGAGATAKWTLVGWNDLGMHCMDGKDYSIYSILPPYNNVHAQLVSSGKLVRDARPYTVTYEAVADPDGSINRTTIGKTNFWDYVSLQYGARVAPDMGLAGHAMPGAANTPRRMTFDAVLNQFVAEGIPVSPYDDAGNKNYYPLMRLTARNSSGAVLAKTDVVLPVSDEMDCRVCHGSGSTNTSRPAAGWAFLPDPERDYKTNVLLLHDEREAGNPKFRDALAAAGFNPAGLAATVAGGKPILCARCHGSNALPGTGVAGVSTLTSAVHRRHANVIDPTNLLALDSVENRGSCYRCHPGSVTKCLRGAMGNATAPDGTASMQCQSCHGNMAKVGSPERNGWLEQPNCQNCHTGTALNNNGSIRYTSAFEASGNLRAAVNQTFATNPDTPLPGTSLFRFSKGHGGLQCESCHGATHAEYPSSHRNDNLQSIALQGYAGTLAECTTCHAQTPESTSGGPHGLHPVGQRWVEKHEDAAERDPRPCRACHGADYRGTVLSAALTTRTLRAERRTITFTKGRQIGCYDCHNGPRGD